jgi:hypothetical protein
MARQQDSDKVGNTYEQFAPLPEFAQGRKRKQTEIQGPPKQVVQQGSVPVLPALEKRRTCGVCVSSSAQLIWIAESLGFRVSWVWACETQKLPMWLKPVYSTTFFTTVSLHLSPVDVVLCDSYAPRWVLDAPEDYPMLVSPKKLFRASRKPQEGSIQRFVKTNHAALGGLTDACQTMRVWSSRDLRWVPTEPSKYLSSMVYSVASDTVQVGRHTKAPAIRVLDPVRVQPLGAGVYHGGGLCPTGLRLEQSRFVLPSVCHQPSGWSLRRLLPNERWSVMDVPWRIVRLTSGMSLTAELGLFRGLLPGRCLEQGLRVLLRGFGLMNEGGVLTFSKLSKQELGQSGKQEIGDKDREPTEVVKGSDAEPADVEEWLVREDDDAEEVKELKESLPVKEDEEDGDDADEKDEEVKSFEPRLGHLESQTHLASGRILNRLEDPLNLKSQTHLASGRILNRLEDPLNLAPNLESQSDSETQSHLASGRILNRLDTPDAESRISSKSGSIIRRLVSTEATKRSQKDLGTSSHMGGNPQEDSRLSEGSRNADTIGSLSRDFQDSVQIGPVGSLEPILEGLERGTESVEKLERGSESVAKETKAEATEDDRKATKADDAAVNVHRWNQRLSEVMEVPHTEKLDKAARVLREFGLTWFRRRLTQSYFGWLHHRPNFQRCGISVEEVVELEQCGNPQEDGSPPSDQYRWTGRGRAMYCDWWTHRDARHWKEFGTARDVLRRMSRATWWEWHDGSRPVHWKWPQWYQPTIQFGLPVWFRESPKQWRRPQPAGKSPQEHAGMVDKLDTVRKRRYLEPGEVFSLTSFFAVPKGVNDIRMVYDGTKSGLNENIWVPRFPLPTVNTHLRAVDSNTWMSDMDIGEMFLNFILHESMQALCGVDLTQFFGEKDETGKPTILWERWTRAAMGLKSSPYQAVQAILVGKELVKGDRKDPKNAFRWDEVRLNLPGSKDYDPKHPWVSKIRLTDGKIAADLFVYVDDARITGPSEEECWAATRQTASRVNELGIQEAARKRRWPSQKPGAWAGSIVEASEQGVYVTVSQERWTKARRYIGEIVDELASSGNKTLDFKPLERKRGFLIYVTRTYPAMVPYLKGIHQTLDSWRTNRDSEGWKLSAKELAARLRNGRSLEKEPEGPPSRVKAASRLEGDLEAFTKLFGSEAPPRRLVRSAVSLQIFYGFGDASGVGHSSNFQGFRRLGDRVEEDDRIHFRYGHWCDAVSEASSNYRELLNLVESLEAQVESGRVQGAEVFLFTDNSTAEAVFFKGNSSSRPLFDLMLRLRHIEMKGDLVLHVIHVAGTRMVEEGADGGSRGDLTQGAMAGHSVIDFVPLHLSALERSENLEQWIRSWWDDERGELTTLSPEGWFDEGQRDGCFLWSPPPAAAEVVAEQLGEARHKRPDCTHITVVPRLMTGRWRKSLGKEADLVLEIPAGVPFWPSSMHEPLILLVSLPLCRYEPWSYRGTGFLEGLRRELRPLWKNVPERCGSLLCKLLLQEREFQSLQEGVVRSMLRNFNWRSVPDSGPGRRGRVRKRRRRR